MTQAVSQNLYSSKISGTNKATENRENNNIYDIADGKIKDAKSVRIKVSDEESKAIALLQNHYSKKLGKEISLSDLVGILVNKNLKDALQMDFTALSKALSAGMTVKLPTISLRGNHG